MTDATSTILSGCAQCCPPTAEQITLQVSECKVVELEKKVRTLEGALLEGVNEARKLREGGEGRAKLKLRGMEDVVAAGLVG